MWCNFTSCITTTLLVYNKTHSRPCHKAYGDSMMKISSFESVPGWAIAGLSANSKHCTTQAGTRSLEIGTLYFLLLYSRSKSSSDESTVLYSRLRMSHSATSSWWISGTWMIVHCQSWSWSFNIHSNVTHIGRVVYSLQFRSIKWWYRDRDQTLRSTIRETLTGIPSIILCT